MLKALDKNVKIKLYFIHYCKNVQLYLVFLSLLSTPLPSPSGCDYWLWSLIQHPVPFFTQRGGPHCCFTLLFLFFLFSLPFAPTFCLFSLSLSVSIPFCLTAPASVTSRAARVCVALCQRRQLA